MTFIKTTYFAKEDMVKMQQITFYYRYLNGNLSFYF